MYSSEECVQLMPDWSYFVEVRFFYSRGNYPELLQVQKSNVCDFSSALTKL